MLALASPDVSGPRSRAAEGAGEQSALPRPEGLHSVEVACDCFPGHMGKFYFLSPYFKRMYFGDSHWSVRYVYWTGFEVMYGQWFKRGMEYPIVGTHRAFR